MSLQGQISHRFFLLNIRHLSYFFCPAPTFSKTNSIKSLNFKCAIFMPYRSRVTVEKKEKSTQIGWWHYIICWLPTLSGDHGHLGKNVWVLGRKEVNEWCMWKH